MIHIKTFQFNPIRENTYVVSDATGEAVVIDCGAFFDAERQAVTRYIEEKGLKLRHALLTHAHFDHIFGVDTLYDAFGVKPRVHIADEALYHRLSQQVRDIMGMAYDRPMPPLGTSLNDGDVVEFGTHSLQVLHTPGHTPGCVLFYDADERVLFSGDTLFRMSVGRTDLEGGSWQQLMDSLQNVVAKLPSDVKVYCGHGPATLIGDELAMNPYFK